MCHIIAKFPTYICYINKHVYIYIYIDLKNPVYSPSKVMLMVTLAWGIYTPFMDVDIATENLVGRIPSIHQPMSTNCGFWTLTRTHINCLCTMCIHMYIYIYTMRISSICLIILLFYLWCSKMLSFWKSPIIIPTPWDRGVRKRCKILIK